MATRGQRWLLHKPVFKFRRLKVLRQQMPPPQVGNMESYWIVASSG